MPAFRWLGAVWPDSRGFPSRPKHRQLRAFTTLPLAPCCAVCAHEGANGRLRAAAGTSARAPWAHSRRRASGEASHPPRSPLVLLRLRMTWQPGTFEEELAPLARALDVITVGERMGI